VEISVFKRIKGFIPFLIIVIILAVAFWVFSQTKGSDDQISGVSGTIEATEVAIIFEVEGRISEVLVDKGDIIHTGDILIRYDDQFIQAQFDQAKARLTQAEADYQWMAAQPLAQERQVAITGVKIELINAQVALKNLIEDADLNKAKAAQTVEDLQQALEDLLDSELQQTLALEEIASAQKIGDEAQRQLTILTTPPPQSAIDQAYANMLLAEKALNQTKEDLEWAQDKLQGNLGAEIPKEYYINEYKKQFRQAVEFLEIKLSQDQLVYQNAVEKYNSLFEPPDPVDVALAQAGLAMAEAQLGQAQRDYERVKDGPSEADIAVLEAQINAAKRDYETLKDGPDPDDLTLAQARVQSAEANLALAQSDTIQEQLAVAQTQVDSARATLQVIQTQLDKLVMTAPVDGVVLLRNIEPGEVAKPGITALTLSPRNDLTMTVFLPEALYDSISLEDEVSITVEAFPGDTFYARVVNIASKSEFISRNVSSSGDRSAYVFAVILALNDPAGLLKPGMQAQVTGIVTR
jgi:HlyD family secretion protein